MHKPHAIYINGQLKYEFEESIWYDTASPAQSCIKQLQEIGSFLPDVKIISFGKEYSILSREEYMAWARDIFSPTGISYECDFSQYL